MSCLYVSDINLSSVPSLEDIFSHCVDFLFTLLMVSFAVEKVLGLISSHLFIFGFGSKKITIAIYVKECSTYVYC